MTRCLRDTRQHPSQGTVVVDDGGVAIKGVNSESTAEVARGHIPALQVHLLVLEVHSPDIGPLPSAGRQRDVRRVPGRLPACGVPEFSRHSGS